MTALRGHIGAASMIARGLVDDDGHLVGHARGLAAGAMEMERIFQEGSNVGESEALPLIWEEPERVREASRESAATAAALAEAAATGDRAAIGKTFAEAGASCKGCHERYKAEDD